MASLVGEIATASNEQASGIEQVNQGIMMVSDVVQKNSATFQESAAASEELSSQADALKEQVSRFKLKKSGNKALPYEEMKNLDPEIIKMLDSMTENKKSKSGKKNELNDKDVPKKIVLDDKEFGKY